MRSFKAKKNSEESEEVTYERLLLSLISIGFSVKDIELFDIGMLIDILTTFNNEYDDTKNNNVKNATQEDFNNFSRW